MHQHEKTLATHVHQLAPFEHSHCLGGPVRGKHLVKLPKALSPLEGIETSLTAGGLRRNWNTVQRDDVFLCTLST